MRRSSTRMSGCCDLTASIALVASAQAATTMKSPCLANSCCRPWSTIGWSSASTRRIDTTRIVAQVAPAFQPGRGRRCRREPDCGRMRPPWRAARTACITSRKSPVRRQNLDSYAGVLGMRLVKRSANQDDSGTYHLFYADAEGHPGSDLTFFPWAARAQRRSRRGAWGQRLGPPSRWARRRPSAQARRARPHRSGRRDTDAGDRPLLVQVGLLQGAGRCAVRARDRWPRLAIDEDAMYLGETLVLPP